MDESLIAEVAQRLGRADAALKTLGTNAEQLARMQDGIERDRAQLDNVIPQLTAAASVVRDASRETAAALEGLPKAVTAVVKPLSDTTNVAGDRLMGAVDQLTAASESYAGEAAKIHAATRELTAMIDAQEASRVEITSAVSTIAAKVHTIERALGTFYDETRHDLTAIREVLSAQPVDLGPQRENAGEPAGSGQSVPSLLAWLLPVLIALLVLFVAAHILLVRSVFG